MKRLEADGVSYDADGARLVDGVSLVAEPGAVVGLVGPNAAGKTTLLRLLAGDLTPSAGEVRIDGRPLGGPAELARRRAVLAQEHLLQFAFTVLDVVLMGRYPHRGTAAAGDDEAVARRAMARTDVAGLAARRYPTLSGGEKTRASLARVLAQEAPIVLLDEPTSSLDVRHQELVMQVLEGLAAAGGIVLVALHDLNLAARYTDRLALLHDGRLAAAGPTRDVLDADLLSAVYGHPVTVIPHPHRDCPLVLVLDG